MELNKIHNINFLKNTLPDKCANLIIADPPYFEVKGDFDFIWKSFDDYLQDVEKWAIECKRLLAYNGTLFWYGDAKKIAYSQVILDEHFTLLNSLVWRKKDSIQYQYYSPENARTFNTHNERILMYTIEEFDILFCYHDSRTYMYDEMKKAKQTYSSIDKMLHKKGLQTAKSAHAHLFINPDSNQGHFVTEAQYKVLQENGMCLGRTYDKLRNDYEQQRRYFNNIYKLEEVLEFSQEAHITKEYDHPTKKPETLTRALIQVCSRPNDLVLVPFAGSGTECAMAVKEGRKTIGFEVTEKHAKMSNERVQNILRQPYLFVGS